jgi:hypothetical protein
MNTNFGDNIKRIVAEQGGGKEAKNALVKAMKMQFVEELKNANEKERPFTKAYLAQKLHEKGRFDLALCNKTLDTLCTALFDEPPEAAPEVTQPEAVPLPQAARKPAAEPTARPANTKAVSLTAGKFEFILLLIILGLLAVFVAILWFFVVIKK